MTLKKLVYVLLVIPLLILTHGIIALSLDLPRLPFQFRVMTILCLFFALIIHAVIRLGWKQALKLGFTVYFVSIFFESIGVATGMVYGSYQYSDKLGLKFLGLVPYLIPIAWFILIYPVFVVMDRLIDDSVVERKRNILLASLSALSVTALDLTLDPIMIRHSVWTWGGHGVYYGIPLQNFLGWFMTAFTIIAIYLFTGKSDVPTSNSSLDRVAVISLLFMLVFLVLVALHDNLSIPALIGAVATAPLLILGWRATKNDNIELG